MQGLSIIQLMILMMIPQLVVGRRVELMMSCIATGTIMVRQMMMSGRGHEIGHDGVDLRGGGGGAVGIDEHMRSIRRRQ